MTVTENRQPSGWVVYAVLALVLAVLLWGGISLYSRYAATYLPSWEGMPEALEAAANSPAYQAATALRANPAQLAKADFLERHDYCCGLTVDLLRSLTPAQVNRLRNRQLLPFSELSLQQQAALMDIGAPNVFGPSQTTRSLAFRRMDFSRSCISVHLIKHHVVWLAWYARPPYQGGGVFYSLSFPASGNPETFTRR